MTTTRRRRLVATTASLTALLLLSPEYASVAPDAAIAKAPPASSLVVRVADADRDGFQAWLADAGGRVTYRSAYTDALLVEVPDVHGAAHALRTVRRLPATRDAWIATPTRATAAGGHGSKKLTSTGGMSRGDRLLPLGDSVVPDPVDPAPPAPPPTSGDGTSGNTNPAQDDLRSWGPGKALTEQPTPDVSLAPLWDFQWDLELAWVGYAWSIADSLGDGVTVAVLDTGVTRTPSLPASRVAPGADFIDPGTPPLDDNGHGTHMASIVAAAGVAVGVAPEATIIPVKVLDADLVGTELALVDGLHYVASLPDVDVVNMSLTFPAGYYPSPLLTEAIDAVHARGIVMVAAAGNDGSRTVGYPARFPEVIAVGSQALTYEPTPSQADSDYFGSRPAYSNTGGALDLCALGGDLSADANADGIPDGILGDRPPTARDGGGLWLTAGTSPASAAVAGAAALLIANGVAHEDVRPLLSRAAFRGYTGANFTATDGAGLLNVGRALELALTEPEVPAAAQSTCFANPIVLFVDDAKDDATYPTALVEVTDADGAPMHLADVYVHFGGQHDDHAMDRTNDEGHVLVTSNVPLAEGEGFVAVTVDAVVSKDGRTVCRPVGTFEVDRLSYELLSNLGTGLISSALVLDYDTRALDELPLVDTTRVRRTLQLRSLGASTTSLPVVFGISEGFYEGYMAGETMVFRTWGTGLISSALILDRAFFNRPARTEWASDSLTVRNYTAGSGLSSSALVWQGCAYPLDTFFTGTMPRVFSMTTGKGLISSALVWDGAGILATDLDADLRRTTYAEPGTSETTRLMSFDHETANLLGGRWNDWQAAYPSGTGLISSALVARYDPYAELDRLDQLSATFRLSYRGTSDASQPLTPAP